MKSKVIVLAAFILAVISIPSAQATPYLHASANGFSIPYWSEGGSNTPSLEYYATSTEESDGYNDPDLSWSLSVHFKANMAQGTMGADILSYTFAPVSIKAGPSAGVGVQPVSDGMIDYFHIDAGETGLPIGTAVQIRFLSSFSGNILLEGKDNGNSSVHYDSSLWKGSSPLAQLDTDTSVAPSIENMHPLENRSINTAIDQLVTVHIGDVLGVYSHLTMTLIGASYGESGYPNEGDNNLSFLNTGRAGIGYAAGCEGLNIWSEGGATIIPEPATICILGLGALSLIRRKK